jgi:hypothetical protein
MNQANPQVEIPRQRKQDIKAQARKAVLQQLPKGGVCVEVGVWRGDFTRMLLNQLKPSKLTLIDPWKSFEDRDAAFDGQTEDAKFEGIYQSVLAKYETEISNGQVDVLRAMSTEAFKDFHAESLDFVYLDGDHSYEGVKADLEGVLPLMKINGVIMLDDFHRRGWWGDGVIRAAQEFLGDHSQSVQIRAMRGAQLAIAKVG